MQKKYRIKFFSKIEVNTSRGYKDAKEYRGMINNVKRRMINSMTSIKLWIFGLDLGIEFPLLLI